MTMRFPASTRLLGVIGAVLLSLNSVTVEARPIPEPTTARYPGVIKVDVDVTDIERKIFQVHETLPVVAGPLTLLFPQWLPGNHSSTGQIQNLAGLVFKANGKALEWARDTVNMYAFHLDVPAGATTLEADYQYLVAPTPAQGRMLVTPDIINLQWNSVVLYPAGVNAGGVMFEPSMRYPADWQFATGLETAQSAGGLVKFKPVDLVNLIDSPAYVGRYFRSFELDPGAKVPVRFNVVADNVESLEATPEQIEAHRKMVQQTYKVFGPGPYAHYDFLIAASDTFGGSGGLEHRQSTEIGVGAGYFSKYKASPFMRGVVPHEYAHVWNGKFRRPADLTTRNYNEPMQNSLLWVYEGGTSYWGDVLAARAGLVSAEETRELLAGTIAGMLERAGRSWRNLQDTTNDPIIAYRTPRGWPSWQRGGDYYPESVLLWLDADIKLRELTGEKKSLDDFARAFYAVTPGKVDTVTYTFEDVVKALNAIAPFDWSTFLRKRLDSVNATNPLDPLGRSGWKLSYSDKPNEIEDAASKSRNTASFAYSLGISIGRQDVIGSVEWGSPAFKAKVGVGSTLVAVNGRAYKQEKLRDAIIANKAGKQPIELLIKSDEVYRTVTIDYRDGLRNPHLTRIEGTPDRLTAILAAKP
jgi:predicted metalloprotease with PDZ domain